MAFLYKSIESLRYTTNLPMQEYDVFACKMNYLLSMGVNIEPVGFVPSE